MESFRKKQVCTLHSLIVPVLKLILRLVPRLLECPLGGSLFVFVSSSKASHLQHTTRMDYYLLLLQPLNPISILGSVQVREKLLSRVAINHIRETKAWITV